MSYSNQGGSFISNTYVNSQVNFYQDINTSRIGVSTNSGANAGFFNGKIDEFRVYDRALTEAEISYLYNSPSLDKSSISDIDGNNYKTVKIVNEAKEEPIDEHHQRKENKQINNLLISKNVENVDNI